MKQYFFKTLGIMAIAGIISTSSIGQSNTQSGKLDDNEQIVIKKKGDKKTKLTVEIKDGEVKVNGKPLSEFNDESVSVRIENGNGVSGYAAVYPRSLFRTGGVIYNGGDSIYNNEEKIYNKERLIYFNEGSAFLGVMSEDHADGAKITSVTKGSSAEKAGLKAGDIITSVNDQKIENPRDLTAAIGKFNVADKIDITINRDNKKQKLSATLGKRSGAATIARSPDMNMRNFDFEMGNLNFDAATGFGFNRGRLGIKAQDTEDEKGVKVLEVDPESYAAKSGIKEGDIILQFNGETVNSAIALAEAARSSRDKNAIKVNISRDGKSQDIDIKIPKKLKTANL